MKPEPSRTLEPGNRHHNCPYRAIQRCYPGNVRKVPARPAPLPQEACPICGAGPHVECECTMWAATRYHVMRAAAKLKGNR